MLNQRAGGSIGRHRGIHTKLGWALLAAVGMAANSTATASAAPKLQQSFTFTRAGTFFPVVRVTSRREDDIGTQNDDVESSPYALIQNLAGVRAVVH